MPLALAAVAAILFGTSDLVAARAGRAAPPLAVTRTAVAVSALLTASAALALSVSAPVRDVAIGAASGLAMVGGLAVLYFGYAESRIGLVAPVSAVVTAGAPVVAGVVVADLPSRTTSVGLGVGLAALVLTSLQSSRVRWDQKAFLFGATAGALFGVAFILMGAVSAEAGLSAVAAQRLAGLGLMTVVWHLRSDPYFVPPGPARRQALVVGALASAAVVALQAAFQRGALGPVAVVGSQFVTVAVVLAVVFDREKVRWWQAIGVACTALSVALLAA